MKKWLFFAGLLVLALYLAALLAIPRISPRPEGLGVTNGQLKPCPGSPNCVSTLSTRDDAYENRSPLPMPPLTTQSGPEAIERLAAIVKDMPRTTIIEQTDNYLYVEFRTFAMRFVDDVEFFADEANGVIHYRSASRLGRKDFGVNGKRMESIIKEYNETK